MTWYSNPAARAWQAPPRPDDAAAPATVRDFHRSLPGYSPTPLHDAPELAAELGVASVLVKDESHRLGMGAFKILGASWAARRALVGHPGATLVSATDGNHGRAVARTARDLGVPARIVVPAVMDDATRARIAAEGAEVAAVDGDYDEAVRTAASFAAAAPDRVLVQDTAWPGYEQVPQWIVDGYATLTAEIDEALGRRPDLIVVPSGVGSLAQAVVAHYRAPAARNEGAAHQATRVLVVDPDTAACTVESLVAGAPTTVPTEATVMAGLNCGTLSALAWPVLRDGCDAAVTVTDDAALRAVADLGALGISSGPSGAATLAGLRAALTDPGRRADLDLPDDAVVVLLSTEGAQP